MKAKDRLEKLRKEKEALSKLSSNLKDQNGKQPTKQQASKQKPKKKKSQQKAQKEEPKQPEDQEKEPEQPEQQKTETKPSTEAAFVKRKPPQIFLLYLFTFGLFGLYWASDTVKRLAKKTELAPSPGMVFLSIIPGLHILFYLKFHKAAQQVLDTPDNLLVFWILFPPLAAMMTQKAINKKAKTKKASHASHKKAVHHKPKKKKKHKRSAYEQRRFFTRFINKAGFTLSFAEVNKRIFFASLVPIAIATIYLIVTFIMKGTFFVDAIGFLLTVWALGTPLVFLAMWIGFFIYVDARIYNRKKEVEQVFPDFLQLTAANINAGMPIDRALWFAIRPRFGILAREMEDVAKATMVGEPLDQALMEFSDKYDSQVVRRALNILLEGIEAGGEVGDILTRVANNIRDTEILRKEMAATVTTYVIFILFATLGAAPFLFGLTTELIVIMQAIMSDINIGEGAGSLGGMGAMFANAGATSISIRDYQIFAIASICMTTTFSSILISVIQKGTAKEALKNIPIYMVIGVIIYLIAYSLLHSLLGGFFA